MATSKIKQDGSSDGTLERIVSSGTLNRSQLIKVNGVVNLFFDLRGLTDVKGNAEIIQVPEGFRPPLGIRTVGVATMADTNEIIPRAVIVISTAGIVKLDFSSTRDVSDVILSTSYGAY